MKDKKILKDFAKVLSIAVSSAGNVKKEAKGRIKERLVEGLSKLDLIQREEFTVFQEILIKLKSDNEDLRKKVELLESKLVSISKNNNSVKPKITKKPGRKVPTKENNKK